MPEFELATIDLLVIGLYVVFILGLGFWVGRKKDSSESYFLAGRGMIWPLVGFALIAGNFSGTQFLGLAGAGYEEGISVWNYEWVATLVLVVFALFILPFYLQTKVSTVPEFFERRYDRRSRYAFSGFTVVTAIFLDSAAALYAGAITLQLLFPDIPLWTLVVIIALLGGTYVLLGGLQAVMITDTVQGILLFVAAGFIFVAVFSQIGNDWSAIPALAPEGGFTVAPPPDDSFMPWPGIFTGVIWLGFYYWCTNQVVVQKVLAARNIDHGRWGALFAGLMQLPLLVLLIFPGIIGRQFFEDLDDPDRIWPSLVFEFLPVGVRGLVLAALIAALMSTLDSVLNGASSLVVNDFIKTRKRELPDKTYLAYGRVSVGTFMIIAALWAPQIQNFPTIVEYFQSLLGHTTMPVVVVLLAGLLWKRGTRHAAFWTLAVGIPTGVVLFFAGQVFELFTLQFLYATGVMLVLSLLAYVGISLATSPEPDKDLEELTWTRENWRRETRDLRGTPWYKNYRYLAYGIVGITVAAVVPFI